ncbi:MAG: Nicotinate-nucleotide adenylyltransferase [Anaerolineae bacterium]|nr:Nicotinate-nucleotide adenylyltransferase [Anaerolineae bacterium]
MGVVIGIIGGTFDPPHLGHLLIAEAAGEQLGLQKVLFVPAADPPHKQEVAKTPASHRCRMVELAIADNPRFQLSTVDLDRPGPHYSVDTVRLLRHQFDLPAEACWFIIGGDSLADLPTWHQPNRLIELCRLAVVHRPGYRPNLSALEQHLPGLAARLEFVPAPLVDVSASHIRAAAARQQSIRYQVPEPVRAYIARQGLYQT